jgi:pimeloyl-ACP methyl ester carboxylesterase
MGEAKFIDVEGIRTRYFEAGKGDPLVFIHGGRFGNFYNAYHWSLNFSGLSSHFHVYAFDKLGSGHTDNPKTNADYTMTKTIDHAYKFLRAAGIERAVLMGHSRGSLPAARIAVDHPDLVTALIVVASNTLAADHPSTPTNFYSDLEKNAPAVLDREFVSREAAANSYSTDHMTPDFVDEMLKIALLPKTATAREKIEHLMGSQFHGDVRKRKYETLDMIRDGKLKAPTLLVWGLNDPSAPIVLGYELFHHIARAVPRTQLHVFNQAGHYVFREHAAEVNRVVTEFILQSAPR